MAQALRNLLDNAIKFSSDVEAPRIEIGGKCLERGCRIWVRDNGVGFDMKYHDRIFELFQCLHPDGKPLRHRGRASHCAQGHGADGGPGMG